MPQDYEPFAARIFFFPNGDMLVRQCERIDHVCKPTSHPGVLVKVGTDQAERLMQRIRQARAGN